MICPRTQIFFVGVRSDEVEVELVGVGLGEEIAAAGEIFQIEELIFFEAMNGFDIALVGVPRRADADVLAVTEDLRKVPFKLATIVGLPDQIAEADAVAIQMLPGCGEAKTALAEALRPSAKAQKSKPLRTSRAVYCTTGKANRCACGQ